MFLYIFCDSVTGEIQQPILAHNDAEAVRIARMAFVNVPNPILKDLYLARVNSYNYGSVPDFGFEVIYRGTDSISEIQTVTADD